MGRGQGGQGLLAAVGRSCGFDSKCAAKPLEGLGGVTLFGLPSSPASKARQPRPRIALRKLRL